MKTLTRWTSNRLFSYVHGNYLVYNTCWEDPRIDREVMRLNPESRVVLITSAGCNALDYVLDSPNEVHTVDLNFRQNALLELKIAGIRRLPFEAFFSLFGDGGHPSFPELYRNHLRQDLSESARRYWDTRQHYLERPTPESSFYHRGTTGVFGRVMVKYLQMAGVHRDALELFSAGSLDEQRRIYQSSIREKLWRPAVKRALRTDVMLSLLGVPAEQKAHLERNSSGTVADFMEDCIESVFTRLSTHDNYFWRLYLFGRYSTDCCPEYLRRPNFERLKAGLTERIHIHTDNLTDFLRKSRESFSHFVLLDHMDWLSHARPDLLQSEWQAIVDRARPNARILWRSAGFQVDFVDPIRVQRSQQTQTVGDLLEYRTTLAQDCHRRDRVHTYGSFYIADLAA
jgi:S-adenosylmethionine-diacylglycerol 3-amino-3-carboxypropyl transferase